MRCECCDAELEAVGTVYLWPQQGGLVSLRRVNHRTGVHQEVEDLAPSEVVPKLLEWGMDEEMIDEVERDIARLTKEGC